MKGGNWITKGLLAAFGVLVIIVGSVGVLYISQYIYAIVAGTIFKIGEDGTLPVTNGTTTFLGEAETSFFKVFGQINTGAEFAGALIVVAVVLLVFGGLIYLGYRGYKKYKGGQEGMDY